MPKACYILRVNKVHRVLSQPIELREKKKKGRALWDSGQATLHLDIQPASISDVKRE